MAFPSERMVDIVWSGIFCPPIIVPVIPYMRYVGNHLIAAQPHKKLRTWNINLAQNRTPIKIGQSGYFPFFPIRITLCTMGEPK
jgi:hypothetical protein